MDSTSYLSPTALKAQSNDVIGKLRKLGNDLDRVIKGLDKFIKDDEIKSKAFDTLKQQMEDYKIVARAMQRLAEYYIGEFQTLANSVGEEELNGEIILAAIEDCKNAITLFSCKAEQYRDLSISSMSIAPVAVNYEHMASNYEQMEDINRRKLAKWEAKEKSFDEKDQSTQTLFSAGASMANEIETALSDMGKAYVDGKYKPNMDAAWRANLNTLEEVEEYKIAKPKGMSDEDYIKYEKQLRDKMRILALKGYWDIEAIKEYVKINSNKISKGGMDNWNEIQSEVDRTFEEALKIGSNVYRKMFAASDMTDKQLADLPIKQMGGYIEKDTEMLQIPMWTDENGIQHTGIEGGFSIDANIPPHDPFWEKYAKTVEKAYPLGLDRTVAGDKAEREKMRRVHQFRMYIDKQNIDYIRRTYPNGDKYIIGDEECIISTDEDRLMAYEADIKSKGSKALYYDEKSRYHNKFKDGEKFTGQYNDKVETSNKHGEFIIDTDSGEFVTQWDVLEYKDGKVTLDTDGLTDEQKLEILNSESFNYGTLLTHHELDVTPASQNKKYALDYKYKQELKRGDWDSPLDKNYKEKINKDYYDEKYNKN